MAPLNGGPKKDALYDANGHLPANAALGWFGQHRLKDSLRNR